MEVGTSPLPTEVSLTHTASPSQVKMVEILENLRSGKAALPLWVRKDAEGSTDCTKDAVSIFVGGPVVGTTLGDYEVWWSDEFAADKDTAGIPRLDALDVVAAAFPEYMASEDVDAAATVV